MIDFSTIPSLPIVALEANDDGHQAASKARQTGRWRPIRKMFWVHIGLYGAADSKSFDGLL